MPPKPFVKAPPVHAGGEKPETAMVTGIASGADGPRVGVYGSSVRNYGVWAESKEFVGLYASGPIDAAYFDGDAYVDGKVWIKGQDVIASIDALQQEIVTLKKQVANLETNVADLEKQGVRTNRGVPVSPPATRPIIAFSYGPTSSGGGVNLALTGSGFDTNKGKFDVVIANVTEQKETKVFGSHSVSSRNY